MSTFAIFLVGLIVTVITTLGAALIGLEEAADPKHSRFEDLTETEKHLVGRENAG